MLPWPGRKWQPVVCAEPGTTSIRFEVTYRGTRLQCTAKASNGLVTFEPLAGVELQVDLDLWMQIAPYLTACALKVSPPDSG